MSVFLFISSTTLIGLAISLLIKREGIRILRLLASIYGIGTAVISFELFLYFVIFRIVTTVHLYHFFNKMAVTF